MGASTDFPLAAGNHEIQAVAATRRFELALFMQNMCAYLDATACVSASNCMQCCLVAAIHIYPPQSCDMLPPRGGGGATEGPIAIVTTVPEDYCSQAKQCFMTH